MFETGGGETARDGIQSGIDGGHPRRVVACSLPAFSCKGIFLMLMPSTFGPFPKAFYALLLSSLLFVAVHSQTASASPPTVNLSLSRSRVVAGEPVFLTYRISNTTGNLLQALWLEETPPQWLEVHLTDEADKEVAAPVFFRNVEESRYDYGKRFKKGRTGIPHTVLFLKPGGEMPGKMALTGLIAAAPKVGKYRIKVTVRSQWVEDKDVASILSLSPDFRYAVSNMGSGCVSQAATYDAPPRSLLKSETSKTLNLTVISAEKADLMARAETLRNEVLHESGEARQKALELLASWPASTASEAWMPLAREASTNLTRPEHFKFTLDGLLTEARVSGNPALLSFMEDLTWKSGLYDQHAIFEQMYANGDEVTQKRIRGIYEAHGEQLPKYIGGWPNFR